jgi:hypothetical protein
MIPGADFSIEKQALIRPAPAIPERLSGFRNSFYLIRELLLENG